MGLFNVFSSVVDEMPPQGIVAALKLERRMLEDDLAHQRIHQKEDARSILCFCQFVDAVKQNIEFPPTVLPAEHVSFYRKTTDRLIKARLLPPKASKWFESAFTKNSFKFAA